MTPETRTGDQYEQASNELFSRSTNPVPLTSEDKPLRPLHEQAEPGHKEIGAERQEHLALQLAQEAGKQYPAWAAEVFQWLFADQFRTFDALVTSADQADERYQQDQAFLLTNHPYLSEATIKQLYVTDAFQTHLQRSVEQRPAELGEREWAAMFWGQNDPSTVEWMQRTYPDVMAQRQTMSRDKFMDWFKDWVAEQRRQIQPDADTGDELPPPTR